MSTQLTGIFCRGVLLGDAKFVEHYRDKSTQQIVSKDIHAIGIEKTIKGGFGEVREVTQKLILSDALMKDTKFLSDIGSHIGQMVEIPLSGYTDFHGRPYVSNDAVVIPCED
jgi:hypothetical protein